MFIISKILCSNTLEIKRSFHILLQLLGDFVPQNLYQALPLQPTGGLPSLRPPGPAPTTWTPSIVKGQSSVVRRATGLKGQWSEGSLAWRVTSPKGQWSEGSLVWRVTSPKGHQSEGSVVWRVTGLKVSAPKGHQSEGSVVWRVTGLKGQWSEGSPVRRVSGPKGHQSEGSVVWRSLVWRVSAPKGHQSEGLYVDVVYGRTRMPLCPPPQYNTC